MTTNHNSDKTTEKHTHMISEQSKQKIRIGMRTIKTALAATACATLYLPFHRNPTFACIGAIFGLGSDMPNSRLNGGNRLFGTIFGGLLGMLAYTVYLFFFPEGGFGLLTLPLLFIAVTLLILISQFMKWPGAIQPGGVMLCIILFSQPAESYIPYSLNRIFDTALGVGVALIINKLLPPERTHKWKKHIRRHVNRHKVRYARFHKKNLNMHVKTHSSMYEEFHKNISKKDS